MKETEILTILKRVFFLPKETIIEQIGKRFFSTLGYPNHMWRNERVIRIMVKQTMSIMKLTCSQGKEVLEIGCGLGFNAIIMALSGAYKVTALDYNEDQIRMLRNMIQIINEPELYKKLKILFGDARHIGLRTSKYDVIQILDVLSHCQDLDKLISEVKRVGKPGSVVYILDGNNGLKFGETKEIIRIQYLAENGPLEEAYRKKRCIGIKSTYHDMRKEIIKKHFPFLDKKTTDELACKTSGMYGEQIISAIDNFLKGKDLIQYKISFPDVCVVKPLYRHPVNGMWPEIAFSPYKLKNYLNGNGISTHVLPYNHTVLSGGFAGFVKRRLAILVKLLYPASIFFAPGFELLGQIRKNNNS
jgi:ubiquinone/menaquinone biosynthesis C-methylase UbiE